MEASHTTSEQGGGESPVVDRAVCVLLCAGEAPGELIASLRGRGVSPVVCRSAFAAMAEICSVGTIGHVPRGGAILLIAEPSQVRGKKALLQSCRKYAPWLRLWVYQHDSAQQLRPFEMSQLGIEDEAEAGDAAGTRDTIPMHRPMVETPPRPITGGGPPSLRLSGQGSADAPAGGAKSRSDGEDDPMGGRLLTDEELSMLLADELDDE